MVIYKIENKINGKIYIGQTIRSVDERFKRHVQDAKSGRLDTHFSRALLKYGEDNFTVSIIDSAETKRELDEKEKTG